MYQSIDFEYETSEYSCVCGNKFDCFQNIPLFCSSCGMTRCKSCYNLTINTNITDQLSKQCQCCFTLSEYSNKYDDEHKFVTNVSLLPNPGVHALCSCKSECNNDNSDSMILSCGHLICVKGLKLIHNIECCSSNLNTLIGVSANCNTCQKQVHVLNQNIYVKKCDQKFVTYDKVTFSSEKSLSKILNFDMRPVYNHLINQGTPCSQAFHGICEYRKFMIMKLLMKDYDEKSTQLSPSPIVDLVWHTHILFTKNYYDFCKKCFRNNAMRKAFHFVHHDPDGTFDKHKYERTMNTILLYMSIFECDVPNSWFSDEFTDILFENDKTDEHAYTIFVKGLDGKTSSFMVTKDTIIFDLKLRIQAKLKIPVLQQRLIFAGCQLEDGYKFGGTKCEPKNELTSLKGGTNTDFESISINVVVGSFNTKLNISANNTINDLIEYITDKTGMKKFEFIHAKIGDEILTFKITQHIKKNVNIMDNIVTKNGIRLKDGDEIRFNVKVEECGIREESTLHLVLRLKGC